MNSDDEPPADEEPFHPLGGAWQDDLEELLDETEYDTELGMEMGKDAMRVTKGELSEEEFHEKYHDDVLAEFGEDERPIASPDDAESEAEGIGSTLLGLARGEESRREMLKKAGAGVGFASLGWGAVDQQEPEPAVEDAGEVEDADEGTQWGMTIDLEHCDGCLSCVTACNQEHNWDEGANWMYVLAFEDGNVESPEPDDFGSVHDFNYLVRPCQHCTDAPCEKVCPTTARHTRDEGGLVLTDYEVCIGCRYCQVACPYGVNYFQWDEPDVDREELDSEGIYDERGRPVSRRAPRGVMSKCVFDPARQDGNMGEGLIGTSACEQACPPNVIQFGDKNNPASDPQRYETNPARARTVINLFTELPSPNSVESSLEGVDANLDAVIDAVDGLTETLIALATAVKITQTDYERDAPPGDSLPDKEETVLSVVSAIEGSGVDLESEDVLSRLGLTVEGFEGPSQDVDVSDREDVAQERLEDYVDAPEEEFELLADIGTNPNVTYLGNAPGPEAHQVPGPTSYEDVGMVDRRQNVLDDETVGLGLRDE
ncbi:4Fe-4S ferredoxin N-terminal domain-containing protein [Natrinema longum]|uniref:4Fe-4S dicluster domain-containing protein n=1 Tax=Natrinema longum TaxID=370324 RepID=A0A8A2UC12_9EURY|nr:4Fe-4S ferredoxin N-terminal domain-containing protein [Natrinema longum]MBZ6495896.1 4Fe-4S dicluster domain-containing protein [Natrinema longum]QSW86163.1 4Fe-4S dicluster domain-containing protein [Natrinema longum]